MFWWLLALLGGPKPSIPVLKKTFSLPVRPGIPWRRGPLFEAPLARTLGLKVAVLGFKLGLGVASALFGPSACQSRP